MKTCKTATLIRVNYQLDGRSTKPLLENNQVACWDALSTRLLISSIRSHGPRGRQGSQIGHPPPQPLTLPCPVQTSTLSALSDAQTAEVWDPPLDLPIRSLRNSP